MTALQDAAPGFDPRVGYETRNAGDDEQNGAENCAEQNNDLAEIRSAVQTFTGAADQRFGAIEAGLTELRTRLDRTETIVRRPGAAPENRDNAGAAERKAFERFLRSGVANMEAVEQRSLRLADDEQAGYLAPPEFVAEIDKSITLFSPVRQVATVRSTARSEVTMLRRTSPASAWWVGEEEDRPETEVKYGTTTYPVCELATFVDVSLQLLEDAAIDVAAEVAAEFAEAFGATEATAFVTGPGDKRPLGFMADPNLSFTPSGSATIVTADGLIDLYHALKPAYRLNGVWFMNSATLGSIRKLKDSTGQYLVQTAAGLAGAPATTLLGARIIEAPDMPDITTGSFPIAFGDFGVGFRIFDRVALSIVRDDFTQRTKGRVRFHGRRRVAGGVRRAEAIRKMKIAAS